jgi:type IV secretory pathway component VirB8
MEQEITKRLIELEEKINRIYISVEKTRKYFLWTMIITVAVVVLPLLGLMFVLPSFVQNYVGNLQGLGL